MLTGHRCESVIEEGRASVNDEVQTTRLILRLMSVQFLEAYVSGNLARAEELIGLRLSEELRYQTKWMAIRLDDLRTDPEYRPWSLRAVGLATSKTVIGTVGFHSRPNPEYLLPYVPDGIELGYGIFTAYRRQGFAEEAVRGLIGWASQEHRIRNFAVSISPANIPSIRLAAKLGFLKVGERMDDEDGLEEVYAMKVAPPLPACAASLVACPAPPEGTQTDFPSPLPR